MTEMVATRGADPACVPLVVDVDGTLLSTDLFWEGLVQCALTSPATLLRLPGALIRGRAAAKAFVASAARTDLASLPYRPEVLRLVSEARSKGIPVVLVSGAHQTLVGAVAGSLGISEFYGSDGQANLTRSRKLACIRERWGTFDYVGNGWADLPLWREARRPYGAGVSRLCRAVALRQRPDLALLPGHPPAWRAAVAQLRVHQWTKNLLLVLPALAGHVHWTGALLLRVLAGFLSFSALASAIYVLNDLRDLEDDRRHPLKRRRPLPSGRLTLPQGMLLGATCLALGVLTALALPPGFRLAWLGYAIAAAAYSLDLKRRLLVDVVALAWLYTIRLFAGAEVAAITLSRWFLAFSVLFFFSLALIKRVVELRRRTDETDREAFGRRYGVRDLPALTSLGSSAALGACLVYGLYITSDDVLRHYQTPDMLWAALPLLLYWQARIWVLAMRGAMDDDPVTFALRDRVTWFVFLAFLALVWLASRVIPIPRLL